MERVWCWLCARPAAQVRSLGVRNKVEVLWGKGVFLVSAKGW